MFSLAGTTVDRRRLLRYMAGAGAALAVSPLIAACGDDDEEPAATPTSAPAGGDETPEADEEETPDTDEDSDEDASGDEDDDATTDPPASGGTITVSYGNIVADTLNQKVSNHTQSRMQARHVLDCLTFVVPETGEVSPWLAESWEVSADSTEYEFVLRQDVTFHDGTPFNAEAVKANFDYAVREDIRRGWAYGALGGENYGGTEVIDEFTVKVTFSAPIGTFLIFLSDGGLGIDSPKALEEYGDDYGVTALVGSGPFKFVELVLRDHLTLERNPDYNWGPPMADHSGPALLDKVVFQEVAENSTRAAALQSADVDMAQLVASQASQFDSVDSVEILLVPKAGTTRFYLMNITREPLNDINVRKALHHAFDAQTFINLPVLSGIGKPAVGPLPSNMVPNGDLSRLEAHFLEYDPEKAVQLLEEAGWEMGSNGIRVKDGQELILDMVVAENAIPEVEPFDGFLNEIGAKLNIRSGDFNFWVDTYLQGDYHLSLFSDSGYNAPGMLHQFFHSEGVYNAIGISDPDVDAAIDAARESADAGERWEHLLTAMEGIVQVVPAVWGWEDQYVFGINTRVQNPGFNEVGYIWLYGTSVSE
jgi:peptide/nickel transport system substrate-binding protein